MATEKIYTQQTISDIPFPQKEEQYLSVSSGNTTKDQNQPATIQNNGFPTKLVARETISSSLNTKSRKIQAEYQFTESGALRIGKFELGVSGEMNLSPDGLSARNSDNEVTFAIDGRTGDATFKGTLEAGTLVGGTVIVGNNTWIIDGDPENPRIILYNNGIPEIVIGEI